jgi:hypothetical protein
MHQLYVYGKFYTISTNDKLANNTDLGLGRYKMGLHSGLSNGILVVDMNTKVNKTETCFVVDISAFPDLLSTNPRTLIVSTGVHPLETHVSGRHLK